MLGLIGKKIGMTTIFEEDGTVVPVTVLKAGPCPVVDVRTKERDGYRALQLGFEPTSKKVSKPSLGHFKKAGLPPHRRLVEFRLLDDDRTEYKIGDSLTVAMFEVGSRVSVRAVSKGKGTQGTVRRWGFSGGPKTHGQSNKFKSPGSIGQSSSPSRVFKGMKMAGKMGNRNVTVRGLRVVKVDEKEGILLVRGAVPGPRGSYVHIRKGKR